MKEPTIDVPVSCPSCEKERLCTLPVAVTAAALLSGKCIKLTCACQGKWDATTVEREQIREYLAMLALGDAARPNTELPAATHGNGPAR